MGNEEQLRLAHLNTANVNTKDPAVRPVLRFSWVIDPLDLESNHE